MEAAVRLATIDNFQGEESTVVVVSTVRNSK
jgi:superfamily I DNA and/or RNA helicase